VTVVVPLSTVAACSSSHDDGGEDHPVARLVAGFDAAKGELPEGLAFRDGTPYVGFAPSGTVARVDVANGSSQSFAQLPGPLPNQGFMTGLAFDAAGALYAALSSSAKEVESGIYRASKDGGDAILFAKHPDMTFPNGLAFDGAGQLWVTDSSKGAVFKIAPDGTTTIFSDHELLKGQRGFCGPGTDSGFDVGANGIALGDGVIYVTNSDKASVIEIAIAAADGSAGGVRTLAGPLCDQLGGADGLARMPGGSLIAAANRLNQVVRVETNGSTAVLGGGAPFDYPASVVVASERDAATLWITSFALASATAGSDPHPGLVRLASAN